MISTQFDPTSTTSSRPRRAATPHGRQPDDRSVTTVQTSNLHPATALLEMATRLHHAKGPDDLVERVAREAQIFIPAAGVMVLRAGRSGPTAVLHLTAGGVEAELVHAATWCCRLASRRLLEAGHVDDLQAVHPALDAPVGEEELLGPARWRSLLVADLTGAPPVQATRLLWYARTPGAFAGSDQLAVLFTRQAGLAWRAVTELHNLRRALSGRTVTGQATGGHSRSCSRPHGRTAACGRSGPLTQGQEPASDPGWTRGGAVSGATRTAATRARDAGPPRVTGSDPRIEIPPESALGGRRAPPGGSARFEPIEDREPPCSSE